MPSLPSPCTTLVLSRSSVLTSGAKAAAHRFQECAVIENKSSKHEVSNALIAWFDAADRLLRYSTCPTVARVKTVPVTSGLPSRFCNDHASMQSVANSSLDKPTPTRTKVYVIVFQKNVEKMLRTLADLSPESAL